MEVKRFLAMPAANPIVSVITPSFNQCRYLAETIASIRAQNFPDIEHIVIDGGSTDGSVELLKNCPDVRWISEPDQGQVAAINKGLRMARGDILTYLNSDDILEPGAVAAAVSLLQSSDAEFVYGDLRFLFDLPDLKKEFVMRSLEFDPYTLWLYDYIPQPGAFWKRSVQDRHGLFDGKLHYAFDYEYWLRISSDTKIRRLPATLATFRIWENSKSGGEHNKPNFLKEIREILLEKFAGNAVPPKLSSKIDYVMGYQSTAQFSFYQPWQNLPFLLQAFKYSPRAVASCVSHRLVRKLFHQSHLNVIGRS